MNRGTDMVTHISWEVFGWFFAFGRLFWSPTEWGQTSEVLVSMHVSRHVPRELESAAGHLITCSLTEPLNLVSNHHGRWICLGMCFSLLMPPHLCLLTSYCSCWHFGPAHASAQIATWLSLHYIALRFPCVPFPMCRTLSLGASRWRSFLEPHISPH